MWSYVAFRWLADRDGDFDIVHFHDNAGYGYFSTLAKQQGHHFQFCKLVFVFSSMTTSSSSSTTDRRCSSLAHTDRTFGSAKRTASFSPRPTISKQARTPQLRSSCSPTSTASARLRRASFDRAMRLAHRAVAVHSGLDVAQVCRVNLTCLCAFVDAISLCAAIGYCRHVIVFASPRTSCHVCCFQFNTHLLKPSFFLPDDIRSEQARVGASIARS